jgi:uncharacterized protein with PQ loop repeat
MQVKLKYIGLAAAIISAMAILPLIVRVTRLKTTHSLSYIWLCLEMSASVLWLWYGTVNKLTAVIVGSILSFTGGLYLISFKVISEKVNCKKLLHKNDHEHDKDMEAESKAT